MCLADRLHKTAAEIMEMTVVEFKTWEIYFKKITEMQKERK